MLFNYARVLVVKERGKKEWKNAIKLLMGVFYERNYNVSPPSLPYVHNWSLKF